MELFNCGSVKCTKTNEFCIEVDGIRIIYVVSFSGGIVTDFILKSRNYNSSCKVVFDSRKGKVIYVDCTGFKADEVKLALEECFKEQKLLYVVNRK